VRQAREERPGGHPPARELPPRRLRQETEHRNRALGFACLRATPFAPYRLCGGCPPSAKARCCVAPRPGAPQARPALASGRATHRGGTRTRARGRLGPCPASLRSTRARLEASARARCDGGERRLELPNEPPGPPELAPLLAPSCARAQASGTTCDVHPATACVRARVVVDRAIDPCVGTRPGCAPNPAAGRLSRGVRGRSVAVRGDWSRHGGRGNTRGGATGAARAARPRGARGRSRRRERWGPA
jgi:hypothetical protein